METTDHYGYSKSDQPGSKYETVKVIDVNGKIYAASLYINMHDGVFAIGSLEFGYRKYESLLAMLEHFAILPVQDAKRLISVKYIGSKNPPLTGIEDGKYVDAELSSKGAGLRLGFESRGVAIIYDSIEELTEDWNIIPRQ